MLARQLNSDLAAEHLRRLKRAAPASRADAEAGKLDQTGGDLPTRRVKTFPVRPDDPSPVLQNR
jgi:hypothetical protein